MSSSVEREVILDVLEAYRDMPFLWDKKDKNYRTKYKRDQGLKVLLEIYKKFEPYATVKSLTKRLHNMKTYYCKELVKVKESIESGSEEPYVPTIWYYDAINFLHPDNESANSDGCESFKAEYLTEVFSDCDSKSEFKIDINESPLPQQSTSLPPVSPTSPLDSPQLSPSPPRKKRIKKEITLSQNGRSEEDKFDIIGRGIGLQLKDLKKKQYFIAQKLIHDTIFYAQMGLLTDQTSLAGVLKGQDSGEDQIEQ